jgi:hypothetical protein
MHTTQHINSSWHGSDAAAVIRRARSRRDCYMNKEINNIIKE